MNPVLFYIFSGLLAFIPALIWLKFIFLKKKNKKIQVFIFLTGIFSVIPIFLLNFLFVLIPEIDFISYFDSQITNIHLHFLLTLSWVSIVEEIIKQWVVRFVDNRKLIIETINDSISFSLIAALGFSFAENIFYFYQIGSELSSQSLFIAFVFRSIFTTCGHLVFSGIFGYYYGIAKFSIHIFEHEKWLGRKFNTAKFLARFLNISKVQAFKEMTILKGLLIAIILHTLFNYFLSGINQVAIAAGFIIICFLYLRHLLKNRAGQLVLVHDQNKKQSTMAKNDEDVVIELLGMWFNQQKYVDVIHICNRLLKRDPDNKIVQLFKAKALDKTDPESPYQKVLSKLWSEKEKSELVPLQEKQKNIS